MILHRGTGPAILVHGGTGAIEEARFATLRAAVRAGAAAGQAVLDAGGSALDAVVAAVRVLEDDPELNAGTGSALTRDGTVETDACVMDGASQRAGAVAAVPDLGCAIALARAVLDDEEHVMLAGPAALDFARAVGIAPSPPAALVTARSRARLAAHLASLGAAPISLDAASGEGGTVGAVARDAHGRFAAATSTGGIVGKRRGRVGDSPVPGAGTWADPRCALSATGDGEAVLCVGLARGIAARVQAGRVLDRAVEQGLEELSKITGGTAGLIAIVDNALVAAHLPPAMPIAWVAGGELRDAIQLAELTSGE